MQVTQKVSIILHSYLRGKKGMKQFSFTNLHFSVRFSKDAASRNQAWPSVPHVLSKKQASPAASAHTVQTQGPPLLQGPV